MLANEKKAEVLAPMVEVIAKQLAKLEHGERPNEDVYQANISIAFVLWLAASGKACLDIPDLPEFLTGRLVDEPELKSYIVAKIGETRWDVYRRLIRVYPQDALAEYILGSTPSAYGYQAEWTTPAAICRTALALAGSSASGDIADICCGTGSFLITAMNTSHPKSVSGFERSSSAACIAKMKAIVAGIGGACIKQDDTMFMSCPPNAFDLVFIDPPYGQCADQFYNQSSDSNNRFSFIPLNFPPLGKRCGAEWIWLLRGLDLMRKEGKVVTTLTQGRLFKTQEQQNRRYLIEAGKVETVVLLPPSLNGGSSILRALLVLSNDNTSIRLIDASNKCTREARCNTMDDEQIASIVKATPQDGFCITITKEDAAQHDYSLHPAEYLVKPTVVPNAVRLSELIRFIGRGLTVKPDQLQTTELTGVQEDGKKYRLVTFSNIRDGEIESKLKSIMPPQTSRLERYIIEKDDVVIGKMPSPFKAAVATPPEHTVLIASTNLFVLRVDTTKCNPYYLQAFLCSQAGQEQIAYATTGVAIQSITADGLANIQVPLLQIDKQERFAAEYRQLLKRAKEARDNAEKATRASSEAFDRFLKKEGACR